MLTHWKRGIEMKKTYIAPTLIKRSKLSEVTAEPGISFFVIMP